MTIIAKLADRGPGLTDRRVATIAIAFLTISFLLRAREQRGFIVLRPGRSFYVLTRARRAACACAVGPSFARALDTFPHLHKGGARVVSPVDPSLSQPIVIHNTLVDTCCKHCLVFAHGPIFGQSDFWTA